jgi:hypothetical protein
MTRRCDRLWEVDAFREGRLGEKDAESFERHRRTCTACAEQTARDERLRELGRALPVEAPSELAMRRLRTKVMRDVATGASADEPRRGWRVGVGAALAAAGVCLAIGAVAAHRHAQVASQPTADGARAPASQVLEPSSSAAEPLAGAVVASREAVWTQAREGLVERVRLDEGTLAVHVRPQRLGERFLVQLPDGEIEVRGTTFQVTVVGAATTRVQVEEGTVELRLVGPAPVRLGAGATWTAPVARPVGPAVDALRAAPSGAPARSPDDGADAYAGAMQLLQRGRDDDAAAAFHAFVLAYPRASQVEDASFLEAVALARAGRSDAAALTAERHLARFPRSFHGKEAAILVARVAAERGECDKARRVLAPWLGADGADGDVDARAALRACGPSTPATVP